MPTITTKDMIRICLNGAAPDTGNLGVNALCFSTLAGISSRLEDSNLTVFDFGRGVRQAVYKSNNKLIDYVLCGLNHSRRYYRNDNIWNMRVCAWLGGLGNAGVEAISNANAMLDISGGDSFTDLYGKHRFDAIAYPKLLSIRQKTPLILLPQTYGPFNDRRSQRIARDILKNAKAAWARDDRSFEKLCDMLGDSFDPSRHRRGVDVAFSLAASKPACSLPKKIESWLSSARTTETIGFNVSGLIFNDPDAARDQYGFLANYKEAVVMLLCRILAESNVNILLIPHVLTQVGHYESDHQAHLSVIEVLSNGAGRVEVLSPVHSESEMKWVISKLDWFCGTRMHSTIAGLSTGVPTTAIAYSLKTQGVFETCGQGSHVVDPRTLPTIAVVEAAYDSFTKREQVRNHLRQQLPKVLQRAEDQMDEIVAACIG